MNELRKTQILDAIADTIRGLLRDEREEIFKSFTQSFQDHDGEGKFKYRLSISASIEPDGQGYDTRASLSYSVTKKAAGNKYVGDGQTDLLDNASSVSDLSESEPAGDESNKPVLSKPGESKEDPLYPEALKFVLEQNGAALIELQKHLNIDFERAAHLIDRMDEEGIIGPYKGVNKREIIINLSRENKTLYPNGEGGSNGEGESKEPVLSAPEIVYDESKHRNYYYNSPSGRAILFVDDGISDGKKWGTFYCKHGNGGSGSLKRLNSSKLPMKDNARDAQLDLDQFAIDHHLQECFEPTHTPPIVGVGA